jgi:hypothetical protein
MSLSSSESDLLRTLVRQVLSEVVPQTMAAGASSSSSAPGEATSEVVHLASDADLQAFARRIARAGDVERAAIVSGATVFRLGSAPVVTAHSANPSANVVRIEKGAVTERHVRDAASTGSSLHLGRKAVLTPLARDRARAAGVEITKER